METKRLSLALLLTSLTAVLSGCVDASIAPPSIRVDPDVAVLEQAARWEESSLQARITLMNLYMAKRRYDDGRRFFRSMLDERPADPLFMAMEATMRVLLAPTVTLTSRVSHVEDALADLDAAVELDPNLPRYLRASVLSKLPPRFEKAAFAITELETLLQDDSFIFSSQVNSNARDRLVRGAHQAIAAAHETLGDAEGAAERWAQAGGEPQGDGPVLATGYSVSGEDGFRFTPPPLWKPVPGLVSALGYDFGDVHFGVTRDGLVAIDAGTDPDRTRQALADVRAEVGPLPIIAVFLTHAHWDHIGGLAPLLEDNPTVIAQAGFEHEQEIVKESPLPFTWFFGEEASAREPSFYSINPDVLVSEAQRFEFGGEVFDTVPTKGGETEDALLIRWERERVVFAGDCFMPYAGAPFTAEGSPKDLPGAIDAILALEPALIVHGHPPLTDNFGVEVLPGLKLAAEHFLRSLDQGIRRGDTIDTIYETTLLPESMADHPEAVMAAYVMRGGFLQRAHRLRTGYWQADASGVEVIGEDGWSAAMDMLAGGESSVWVDAIEGLLARGDDGLALRMADRALRSHPTEATLIGLRQQALGGLRVRHQSTNPFRFIVYSELSGTEQPAMPE